VPKTYDELLAALPKLRAAGFDHPFTAAYKTGWDVATEFTNIYLGAGGQFFQPGTARPAFNNARAVQALELMAKLKGFMSPNAQALATGDVTTAFQQGQAAIGMLWASRAAAMDDAAVSKVKDMVGFAAAPAVTAGGRPANAVWWDALVMPKAMDGDREAAFQLMMEALSEDTMKAGMNLTNWLRASFVPNRYAEGVAATLAGNAELWPDQPFFSLAHTALGKAAADVLAGTKAPAAALADAEREYTQTARERGFLQ
jgi:ABC-type glycerol-3-phosphate transport system substrate-binding protein